MNKMTEKQLDNLFSFDAGDILSLNIFGGVYNNNSMSIVFNAELIVAKKNGKFWYVMGRHQSEEV